GIVLLEPSEICYLAAASGKVFIVAKNRKYESWESLKDWEDRLRNLDQFVKCHRSYIVNIDAIDVITPWINNSFNISIKDMPDRIYCSRNYWSELKKKFDRGRELV
ncbi:MAG: LytTR family transcriptional regulator, partial [Clostridiales bacterium]|nr:LytTR family transcriptional regulator [Clostridiales bacterium]